MIVFATYCKFTKGSTDDVAAHVPTIGRTTACSLLKIYYKNIIFRIFFPVFNLNDQLTRSPVIGVAPLRTNTRIAAIVR